MNEQKDNPYSPPLAEVVAPDRTQVSRWRLVWAIVFFVLGTNILLYIGPMVMSIITFLLSPHHGLELEKTIPLLVLWTMVGIAWIWASRSFWLEDDRRGRLAAALGFLILLPSLILLGLFN